MYTYRNATVAATLLLCVATTGCATPEVRLGDNPVDWLGCVERRDPGCTIALGGDQRTLATETRDLLHTVLAVNNSVNRMVARICTEEQAENGPEGQKNWWSSYDPDRPILRGQACLNCISYAVSKRRVLLEAGVPPAALRFARVQKRGATSLHLVLLLYTDERPDDPYVLDNLIWSDKAFWSLSEMLFWSYTLHEMQGEDGLWYKNHAPDG